MDTSDECNCEACGLIDERDDLDNDMPKEIWDKLCLYDVNFLTNKVLVIATARYTPDGPLIIDTGSIKIHLLQNGSFYYEVA